MDSIYISCNIICVDVVVLVINNVSFCGLVLGIGFIVSIVFVVVYWDCVIGYYFFVYEIGYL